jgi:hypothetical protein
MDSLPLVGKPSYHRQLRYFFLRPCWRGGGCYVRRRVVWRLQRGRRDKARSAKTKVVCTGDPAGDLCYKSFHTLSFVLDFSNEYNPPFLVIGTLVNFVLSSRAPQPAVAIPRSFREENPSLAAMQQVACSLLPIARSPGLAHERRLHRHQPSFVAFPSASLFAAATPVGTPMP